MTSNLLIQYALITMLVTGSLWRVLNTFAPTFHASVTKIWRGVVHSRRGRQTDLPLQEATTPASAIAFRPERERPIAASHRCSACQGCGRSRFPQSLPDTRRWLPLQIDESTHRATHQSMPGRPCK